MGSDQAHSSTASPCSHWGTGREGGSTRAEWREAQEKEEEEDSQWEEEGNPSAENNQRSRDTGRTGV